MADGQVVFEITGDNRPIEQSLRDTTRAIDRESRNWDASTRETAGNMENNMVSMFRNIASAAAAAGIGRFLLDIGRDAVEAASDLQEVQNVVDVTFGDSARQIQNWADKARTQFGLTELQAKQFTSTLGAMMKSAGLAGPEIVDMSTSLAGLAADMASFYNLDFETAFQKIRAGISGETEPLKQLGVNMSVANLEAYALTQGITKAFDKMSQSEQTVLRYQYLMQATADAQGDFARTSSDSFANMRKNVETNLQSIEASIGNLLIGPAQGATDFLNEFLKSITKKPELTVLDEIANIDLQTNQKISEIRKTAGEASSLLSVLEKISQNTSATVTMETLARGANALNSSSPQTWGELLSSLQKIDGLQNVFSGSGAGNVESLAQALSGSSPDVSKAEAWQTFLDALNVNPEALAALTGKSAEETAKWLKTIGDAAQNINPEDADAWDKLLSNFVSGLPGFEDTDAGKAFFASITSELLAMGSESEEAESRLAALGMSTDDIDNAQKKWLETCKRLVQLIPGLSEIINTQTGEIKGGTQAVQAYARQWVQAKELMAEIESLEAKRAIIRQYADTTRYEVDAELAKARYQQKLKEYGKLPDYVPPDTVLGRQLEAGRLNTEGYLQPGTVVNEYGEPIRGGGRNLTYDQITELYDLYTAVEEAETELERQQTANKTAANLDRQYEEAITAKTEQLNNLSDTVKGVGSSSEQTAESLSLLARAAGDDTDAMNKVKTALENAQEAFKNLADYQEKVRQETAQSVAQVIKGFESMGEKGADGLYAWNTPAEEASRKMKDLTEQMGKLNTNTKEGKKQWEALNAQINQLGGQKASVQNMSQSLESQLAYIREYKKMMDEARRLGVSEEILASLSDGSQQSFDYLKALTTTGGNITGEGGLNDLYRQVQEESAGFVDELTKQKLAADETYHGLVATAQQAIASLNLGETAYNSVAATVDGIVKALGDKKTEVKSQVDGILFQIGRLGLASGYGTNFNRNGMLYFSAPKPKGSQANGLDYVPYDGLFMLHQGERVETAAENELSRHYSNRAPGFDYNAMGSAVGANMPNMGNMQIVWRGRVVADVLSGMQADSYRALERSGWQQ